MCSVLHLISTCVPDLEGHRGFFWFRWNWGIVALRHEKFLGNFTLRRFCTTLPHSADDAGPCNAWMTWRGMICVKFFALKWLWSVRAYTLRASTSPGSASSPAGSCRSKEWMWLTKENFDKISDTTVSFFVLQDALEADVEEWKKQPRQAAQVWTAKVFLASNWTFSFVILSKQVWRQLAQRKQIPKSLQILRFLQQHGVEARAFAIEEIWTFTNSAAYAAREVAGKIRRTPTEKLMTTFQPRLQHVSPPNRKAADAITFNIAIAASSKARE